MLAQNPQLISRKAFIAWYERFNNEKPNLPLNCAYVECIGPDKRFITWDEVMKERKIKQKCQLSQKRFGVITEWKPGYIWIFFNKQEFPFGGWYCYIVTLKKDWCINFRDETLLHLQEKVMKLFPCEVLPLQQYFYEWMEEFEKRYHINSARKKDGKTLVWCKIKGSHLIDIDIKNNAEINDFLNFRKEEKLTWKT